MSLVLPLLASGLTPALVMLAAVLGYVGAKTSTQLGLHAREGRAAMKAGWTFLAALVAGAAIWTTHFLLIMAFHSHQSTGDDATHMIVTFLLAVAGAGIAFTAAALDRRGAAPAICGALLGLAIAATYNLGLASYDVGDTAYLRSFSFAAPAVLSIIVGGLATTLLDRHARGATLAPILLVAAFVPPHLVGVFKTGAPIAAAHINASEVAKLPALTLAIALVAILIIAAGSVVHMIDLQTQKDARDRIDAVSLTDSLTGLPNRAAFDAEIRRRAAEVGPGEHFAILAIDIGNIVSINQRYGTRIGDLTIQAIANRLLGARRQGVFLARTGGSEICGIGVVADRGDTWDRMRKMHAALSSDLVIDVTDIAVDIRIGGAMYPNDAEEPDLLMRNAQIALARAKADPLEQTALHDEVEDTSARRRLMLANDLRGAVDRHEFELFYQPQVWIADRRTIGYEALLRWHHPDLGMVSPAEFIPIAEKTGTIVAIGAWVLRMACAVAAEWDNDYRIAVNVSPLQLRQPDLPRLIEDTLRETGLAPHRLEIELTESLLIEDRPRALRMLREIKALGVRLALDDFGTGHSSMDVLRQFPFDKVKLDKTFVDDVEKNRQARAILHAMLAMGRALGIPVLVEGVESERQLAILRREGCNKVQGYLTGRPMALAEIVAQEPMRLSA